MENTVLIQKVLALSGTVLTFSTFSLKGIISIGFPLAYTEGNSFYEVALPQIEIMADANDLKVNSVVSGLQFSVTDGIFIFTCTIDNIDYDMTGWAIIKASFKSKAAI